MPQPTLRGSKASEPRIPIKPQPKRYYASPYNPPHPSELPIPYFEDCNLNPEAPDFIPPEFQSA